jgi:hypothetical protein
MHGRVWGEAELQEMNNKLLRADPLASIYIAGSGTNADVLPELQAVHEIVLNPEPSKPV